MLINGIGHHKTQCTRKALQKQGFLDYMGLYEMVKWLGWQDSNLRMTRSKPVALPLGYTPIKNIVLIEGEHISNHLL